MSDDLSVDRCSICGTPMMRETRPQQVEYRGETETVDVPGLHCPVPECDGDSTISGRDLRAWDEALERLKARVEAREGQEPPQ